MGYPYDYSRDADAIIRAMPRGLSFDELLAVGLFLSRKELTAEALCDAREEAQRLTSGATAVHYERVNRRIDERVRARKEQEAKEGNK